MRARKALALGVISQVVRLASAALLIFVAVPALGLAEFAKFTVAQAILSFSSVALDFGHTQSGVRDYASSGGRDGGFVSRFLAIKCGLALLLMPATALLAVLTPILRGDESMIALTVAISAFHGISVSWWFAARARLSTFYVFEIIAYASYCLMIALILPRSPSAATLMILFGVSQLIFLLAVCGTMLIEEPLRRAHLTGIPADVKRSIGSSAVAGMLYIQNSFLTFLLSFFAPASFVGAYGIADRVAGAAVTVFTAIGPITQPAAVERARESRLASLRYALTVSLLLALPYALGAIIFYFFADDFAAYLPAALVPALSLAAGLLFITVFTPVKDMMFLLYFCVQRMEPAFIALLAVQSAIVIALTLFFVSASPELIVPIRVFAEAGVAICAILIAVLASSRRGAST